MPPKSESNTLSQCLIILGSNSEKKWLVGKETEFDAGRIFLMWSYLEYSFMQRFLVVSRQQTYFLYLLQTVFMSICIRQECLLRQTTCFHWQSYWHQSRLSNKLVFFFTVNHFVVFLGGFFMQQCVFVWVHKAVNVILTKKRWDMKWFTWFSLWLIFKPSSFWFIHFQIYTCTCNIHACITKLVVGFQYDQTVKIWIIWFNKSWYGESESIVSMYTLIYG